MADGLMARMAEVEARLAQLEARVNKLVGIVATLANGTLAVAQAMGGVPAATAAPHALAEPPEVRP